MKKVNNFKIFNKTEVKSAKNEILKKIKNRIK
jgi:hypothetical protein